MNSTSIQQAFAKALLDKADKGGYLKSEFAASVFQRKHKAVLNSLQSAKGIEVGTSLNGAKVSPTVLKYLESQERKRR